MWWNKTLEENEAVIFDYDEELEKAVNVRKITEKESNVEDTVESE